MLIKCSECGKEISDKASACPNCGCPIEIILNIINQEISKEKIENENYQTINSNQTICDSNINTNKYENEKKQNKNTKLDTGEKVIVIITAIVFSVMLGFFLQLGVQGTLALTFVVTIIFYAVVDSYFDSSKDNNTSNNKNVIAKIEKKEIDKDSVIKYTKILGQSMDSRKSFSSSATRGLIGGIALGPVGAIAGAVSGKNKTKSEVIFLVVYESGRKETRTTTINSYLYNRYIQYLRED